MKRVCELKVNDVISYNSSERIVWKVENGFVYIKFYPIGKNTKTVSLGWRSQEKVMFHFNTNDKNND